MPRPRKEEAARRTETLAFRLTPDERMRIERAAADAGTGPSEYARMQTLKGRVVVRPGQSLDPALFEELRRIGVNLNQLARHANTGRERPAELARTLAALDRILASALPGSPALKRHTARPPEAAPASDARERAERDESAARHLPPRPEAQGAWDADPKGP